MIFLIKKKSIIFLFFLLVIATPIFSDSLIYDRNGANLNGFSINSSDSGTFTSGSYPSLPGYAGRLIYTGDETQLVWRNDGETASGGSNNKFYLIRENSNTEWREIYFVLRIKGKRRNNSTLVNHTSTNDVIVSPSATLTIPGAGNELLTENGPGFTYNGNTATYDGTNGPIYKHKYEYAVVEITIVRTATTRGTWLFGTFWGGQFISIIGIAGESVHAQLQFSASSLFNNNTSQYTFSVERTIDNTIPMETLIVANSYNNRMQVGTVRYQSYFDNQGTIYFSSSSSTTQYDYNFVFSKGTNTFGYSVVFDDYGLSSTPPIIGNPSTQNRSNGFSSRNGTATSPLGGNDANIQLIEGGIYIFLNDPTAVALKPPGTYSSTIYCLLIVN